VLIADDESRIRLVLRACLEAEGYRVEEAADGLEALESVRRSAPDVVILDLSMPRMMGIAVLKELSGQSTSKVIVLTAYGCEQTAIAARKMGAAAFLEKPLLPDMLRQTVRDVLAQRSEMHA
jgi:DNA-binding NtrC family response regulator